MKKNLFKIVMGAAVLATSFSSCTKEQTSLNLLKGTWTLDAEYDSDGDLVDPTNAFVESVTNEITFFECNGKDNDPCTGTAKTTTKYVNDSELDYSASDFSYEVHDKSILIISGTVYEIDELKKSSLKIHPASSPLAVREYSK